MITAPTQASQEAMEAKTLVVPPKERTGEGGLPSGGEIGQVVTKTADGAEWAAQSVGLCKNTSASTKISFSVPNATTLPSTPGGTDSWTINTIEVPNGIMNILNGQYENGAYATGVANVVIEYPDPEDPEETVEVVEKGFLNYRVRYISNGNMEISFDQFNYISPLGNSYSIAIPAITYYSNAWSTQGSDIEVECIDIPTESLLKSTSTANRFGIMVPEDSEYPETGSDTSWTVIGISVPSAIMSILNSQYQANEYAAGMIGIEIATAEAEYPDVPVFDLITKDLKPFNVSYTGDGNLQISFAEFYHVSASGKLYKIVIDPIDYEEGSWDTQGVSIHVECLMETAQA